MSVNLDPRSSPLAYFAAEVKRLRAKADITQEALANATHYAPSTIAAIETCRLIPSKELAAELDKAFGMDGDLARLQGLVEESVLPWFRDRVKIERKAAEIRVYESYVIPGLLQTENYARCSMSGRRPPLTTDEIERAVALRMTRQEIINQEVRLPVNHEFNLHLWAIVEESVLRRVVGGREVMTEQLEHLVKMSERANIVVQVIPESEGTTAAGGRSFTLLTFKADPTVVYLEDLESARYIRKPDEVSRYTLTFDYLRSNALTDEKSRALIRGEKQ